jgi:hypothetical protein
MAAAAPPDSIMCAGNCCGAAVCFTLCPFLVLCASHQGLRTAYGIQGSCFGDCMAGCVCSYCAQLQQAREVQIRNSAPPMAAPMIMMAAPQQQQVAYVVAR